MATRLSALRGIALSTVFVGLLLGVLVFLGAFDDIIALLRWLEAHGGLGLVLFIIVMALAVVLLLPGAPLTTGAGAIFGVTVGTIGVVLGTTLGATVAFLLARFLFGDKAGRFVLRHSRIKGIREEVARQSWRVVLLTRLVPFFPGKLSNYFFGLAGFSLRGFVFGTLVGIIPLSLHNVYLGAVAADAIALGREEIVHTPLEWSFLLAGLVLIIGAVLALGRIAQRALAVHEGFEETQCPG